MTTHDNKGASGPKPNPFPKPTPKPAPKNTIPTSSPKPPSPQLKSLLKQGQQQGKQIQAMHKPGGLMNMNAAPPKPSTPKIGAPKPALSKAPSSNLQSLLKQGQQQGKQIQGMQNKK